MYPWLGSLEGVLVDGPLMLALPCLNGIPCCRSSSSSVLASGPIRLTPSRASQIDLGVIFSPSLPNVPGTPIVPDQSGIAEQQIVQTKATGLSDMFAPVAKEKDF